jgi:hypothetical protein
MKEFHMAIGTSARAGEKSVQDWINLVCGVLVSISPWALGFSADLTASRSVWVWVVHHPAITAK